jgi:hypothetical protein
MSFISASPTLYTLNRNSDIRNQQTNINWSTAREFTGGYIASMYVYINKLIKMHPHIGIFHQQTSGIQVPDLLLSPHELATNP